MHAVLTNYTYWKSQTSFRQGVKGGRVPRGAVAGGNGSFYVAKPPEIILRFEGPKGGRFAIDVSDDVATYIHGYLDRKVTEKQVRKIFEPLIGTKMEISENRREIINIGRYFPD